MPSRRRFLASTLAAGVGLPAVALPAPLGAHRVAAGAPPDAPPPPGAPVRPVTVGEIAAAEAVFGLSFAPGHRELMVDDVNDRLESLAAIRAAEPLNSVPPALVLDLGVSGEARPAPGDGAAVPMPTGVRRPASDRGLAFLSISELGALLRGGAVTAVELAELSLDRLERFDPTLQAVVTLTRDRALRTARARDAELAAGIDLGPLHGIPYGAKDLVAARGYPTTWGAEPYRGQTIDEDAAVVQKLEAAGAVLVAKLTLGALAWGDVWFGGTTKNPWNPDQGASGSSAGPGAAVAAGLVPFAVGSETLGSIVSPSTRNGVTGLRPTFGRVPTRGAMALSWSMDKLGPMTRSALDAALVFDALRGPDPEHDRPAGLRSAPDSAFPFRPGSSLGDLRVGVLDGAFDADGEGGGEGGAADRATLAVLDRLGVETEPVALPSGVPVSALLLILEAEAAAAFSALTRSGGVDLLVRQTRDAWPNVFRHGHLVPAVDYLNANRLRTVLMREMADLFERVDVLVTPSFGNAGLATTNLTGHPAVVVPNGFFPVEGFPDRRAPHSVTFLGPLWKDHLPLRLAHAYQEATDFHTRRPPVS